MRCLLTIPTAVLQIEARHHVNVASMSPVLGHLALPHAGAAAHQGAAEMRPHVAHSTCAILWRVAPP